MKEKQSQLFENTLESYPDFLYSLISWDKLENSSLTIQAESLQMFFNEWVRMVALLYLSEFMQGIRCRSDILENNSIKKLINQNYVELEELFDFVCECCEIAERANISFFVTEIKEFFISKNNDEIEARDLIRRLFSIQKSGFSSEALCLEWIAGVKALTGSFDFWEDYLWIVPKFEFMKIYQGKPLCGGLICSGEKRVISPEGMGELGITDFLLPLRVYLYSCKKKRVCELTPFFSYEENGVGILPLRGFSISENRLFYGYDNQREPFFCSVFSELYSQSLLYFLTRLEMWEEISLIRKREEKFIFNEFDIQNILEQGVGADVKIRYVNSCFSGWNIPDKNNYGCGIYLIEKGNYQWLRFYNPVLRDVSLKINSISAESLILSNEPFTIKFSVSNPSDKTVLLEKIDFLPEKSFQLIDYFNGRILRAGETVNLTLWVKNLSETAHNIDSVKIYFSGNESIFDLSLNLEIENSPEQNYVFVVKSIFEHIAISGEDLNFLREEGNSFNSDWVEDLIKEGMVRWITGFFLRQNKKIQWEPDGTFLHFHAGGIYVGSFDFSLNRVFLFVKISQELYGEMQGWIEPVGGRMKEYYNVRLDLEKLIRFPYPEKLFADVETSLTDVLKIKLNILEEIRDFFLCTNLSYGKNPEDCFEGLSFEIPFEFREAVRTNITCLCGSHSPETNELIIHCGVSAPSDFFKSYIENFDVNEWLVRCPPDNTDLNHWYRIDESSLQYFSLGRISVSNVDFSDIKKRIENILLNIEKISFFNYGGDQALMNLESWLLVLEKNGFLFEFSGSKLTAIYKDKPGLMIVIFENKVDIFFFAPFLPQIDNYSFQKVFLDPYKYKISLSSEQMADETIGSGITEFIIKLSEMLNDFYAGKLKDIIEAKEDKEEIVSQDNILMKAFNEEISRLGENSNVAYEISKNIIESGKRDDGVKNEKGSNSKDKKEEKIVISNIVPENIVVEEKQVIDQDKVIQEDKKETKSVLENRILGSNLDNIQKDELIKCIVKNDALKTYRNFLENFWADKVITEDEKLILENLHKDIGLARKDAFRIKRDFSFAMIQKRVNSAYSKVTFEKEVDRENHIHRLYFKILNDRFMILEVHPDWIRIKIKVNINSFNDPKKLAKILPEKEDSCQWYVFAIDDVSDLDYSMGILFQAYVSCFVSLYKKLLESKGKAIPLDSLLDLIGKKHGIETPDKIRKGICIFIKNDPVFEEKQEGVFVIK